MSAFAPGQGYPGQYYPGQDAVAGEIHPNGFANVSAFGTVALHGTIATAGLDDADAFGVPGLNGQIAPAGISSSAAVGQPSVIPSHQIEPVGIAGAEDFGVPSIQLRVVSGAALARLVLPQLILARGIQSEEGVGLPFVALAAPAELGRRKQNRRNRLISEALRLAA